MGRGIADKLNRFRGLFKGGDQVLVLINADPDAIASAMAVKRLLWRKVSGVTISHVNTVKRPDNIAMIRLLGVNPVHVDELPEKEFQRVVMVDSQPGHHPAFSRFSVDAVIDHHPDTVTEKVAFRDIRPDYGAAASMLTEYIRSAKIKPSAKLATAIFYAIKTDTQNFQRKTQEEDLRAFQFAFKYANLHLVAKIENADLRFDFLKYFRTALDDISVRRGRLHVHLGNVSNPDVCVLVADFFMRIQSIGWSIVSGIHENKLVLIFRNDGLRKNAGKTAERSFGFFGTAGGHKSAARAEIPLDRIPDDVNLDDDVSLKSWIVCRIEAKQRIPKACFSKKALGMEQENPTP